MRSPTTYTPSAVFPIVISGKTVIAGSNWLWESPGEVEGVFTFVRTFVLAEWARVALTSLRLSIAADDHFSVVFNGQVIAPQWTGGYTSVSQYELKTYALGSSEVLGVQENRLEMIVWNFNAFGGLVYKLDFMG